MLLNTNLMIIQVEHFKGTFQILLERGLVEKDTKLLRCCKVHSGDRCCLEQLISQQEDFQEQKSMLEESLVNAGHLMTLYPKYHCETNWIERHWGESKRIARLMCDYKFKSLKENIDSFLDDNQKRNGTLTIRRWYNLAFRYIEAYSQGHDAIETNEIVKKFSKVYKSQMSRLKEQQLGFLECQKSLPFAL